MVCAGLCQEPFSFVCMVIGRMGRRCRLMVDPCYACRDLRKRRDEGLRHLSAQRTSIQRGRETNPAIEANAAYSVIDTLYAIFQEGQCRSDAARMTSSIKPLTRV